jgi:adenylate kinase
MSLRTVLLFGPPGSGKGTQGKILGAMPGYFHCACGDVFRSLDRNSPMGIEFAKYSTSGSLVPDELTVQLWRDAIAKMAASKRYKPDEQYLLLDGINDIAQIVVRLGKRAAIENRLDDTDIEVIRHRIDVYEEQTQPLLNLYPRNIIFRVNATRPLEAVTADILAVIQTVKQDW